MLNDVQPSGGVSQYRVNDEAVGNGVGAGRSSVGPGVRLYVGSIVGLDVG